MAGCTIALEDEAATARFAQRLAALCRPGDVIALSGALGAGRSVLARAFIRARAGDPALTVPSPTFTLVQPYDLPGGAVSCESARARVQLGRRAYLSWAMILPNRDQPGVSQRPASSPAIRRNKDSRGSAAGSEAATRS